MNFIQHYFFLCLFTQSLLCMERPSISQFLENPTISKRLKMEISELSKNTNFDLTCSSINSETNSLEMKIKHNNAITDMITCQISPSYPFQAPLITFSATNNLPNKDLDVIHKKLNENLKNDWRPQITISKIIEITHATIKEHENNKIARQKISEGHVRTLIHLKEKYQSNNVTLYSKYPELEDLLKGLWVRKASMGHFIFHAKDDLITMAFEPQHINDAPLSYCGNYAAENYEKYNNQFEITISGAHDQNIVSRFKINIQNDYIEIIFFYLKNNSTLNTILSHLEIKNIIGAFISLNKV